MSTWSFPLIPLFILSPLVEVFWVLSFSGVSSVSILGSSQGSCQLLMILIFLHSLLCNLSIRVGTFLLCKELLLSLVVGFPRGFVRTLSGSGLSAFYGLEQPLVQCFLFFRHRVLVPPLQVSIPSFSSCLLLHCLSTLFVIFCDWFLPCFLSLFFILACYRT